MQKVYKITPKDMPEFSEGMYFTNKEDAEAVMKLLQTITKPGLIVEWDKVEIDVMDSNDWIETILKWAFGKTKKPTPEDIIRNN